MDLPTCQSICDGECILYTAANANTIYQCKVVQKEATDWLLYVGFALAAFACLMIVLLAVVYVLSKKQPKNRFAKVIETGQIIALEIQPPQMKHVFYEQSSSRSFPIREASNSLQGKSVGLEKE
ncbi:Hypothetical_protein [Hexamita inflata]|uniref:Hypothetical_protein n=1 Tax=Hexamita inflata TaxID=28002 RepID=A0AA86Q9C4_9EUKA|nr:Hypothetical protein HINF_LOCUS39462 [Hexamita inflata]